MKFDSFFSKGFKAARCKALLKLTVPRIKLLRNRKGIQIKQMRRQIAKLLETGQEVTARIRVEHVIREEKMMAAREMVELFCELITVRLPIIEAQRECPLDLKEAISSLCFAAPRCADLPELLQVQMLFAGKYGKKFVSSATDLMPECGVSWQLVEFLSIQAPAPDIKLKLLKEIAEEHELEWDPNSSESELLKTHEDLLTGPTQFVNGSKVPLPKAQHDVAKSTTSDPAVREHSDSDEDFDIIDFPEVPRQPLQPKKGKISTPQILPFPASALSDDDDDDDNEEQNSSRDDENLPHLEEGATSGYNSVTKEDVSLKISANIVEDKQFVPFVYPPSQSSVSFAMREHDSPPSTSKPENYDVDLQDVLVAAHVAAEITEQAAAAARSAAILSEICITELMKKKNNNSNSNYEVQFQLDKLYSGLEGKTKFDLQNSIVDSYSPFTSPGQNNVSGSYIAHQPTTHPSYDDAKGDFDSSAFSYGSLHQPKRLPSMDDNTYFLYPNLFTSRSPMQSFGKTK